MDRPLSAAPLLINVRAQLLARPRWLHHSSVELAELSQARFESAVCRSAFAHDAHRGVGNDAFRPAWLSARVLPVLSRRRAQRTVLSTRNRAALGQLLGA